MLLYVFICSSLFSFSHKFERAFQDVVNTVQWRRCCFSNNTDYVIATSAEKSDYRIYIWNRIFGQLVKILHQSSCGCVDMTFHPTRALLITVTTQGALMIWVKNYAENWSAFAPDFQELEDNTE
jgi:COMPASS component SWD1